MVQNDKLIAIQESENSEYVVTCPNSNLPNSLRPIQFLEVLSRNNIKLLYQLKHPCDLLGLL